MKIRAKKVIIAAGGTGGHINAAIALGLELSEHDNEVLYLSGKRPLDYKLYNGYNVIHLNSYPLRSKNPLRILMNITKNIVVFFQTLRLVIKYDPSCMIGAGGYVCGPTLLAGYIKRIPVFILEQNSVMGLTNKLLSYVSTKIFTSFDNTYGIYRGFEKKVITTGNPTRREFLQCDFHQAKDEKFRILVFGGSLGALDINNLVKTILKQKFSREIEIIHQVGIGKGFSPVERDKNERIRYQQLDYIDDICQEYKRCDLVICRSGASTISELRIVQKTAILIPLTLHKDKHQVINASELKASAKFKVYVNSTQELIDNRCSLLSSIIEGELADTKSSGSSSIKSNITNSTQMILEIVADYV